MVDGEGVLEQAVRGDREAQEELLERYLPPLRAFVRLRMGSFLGARESAADVVQTVMMEALENLQSWQCHDLAQFKRRLFRCAEQRIVDRIRYFKSQRRDPTREVVRDAFDAERLDEQLAQAYRTFASPSRDASAREEVLRIERAFEQLPDDYRKVILLSRVVGLEYPAIAEEMGRTTAAIWNLVSRGLARLAVILKEQDENDAP